MRRIYAIDLPCKSVLTLAETPQSHLVKLTLQTTHTDPVEVLLDEATFQELAFLKYSFSFKKPEAVVDVTNQVLTLAAA